MSDQHADVVDTQAAARSTAAEDLVVLILTDLEAIRVALPMLKLRIVADTRKDSLGFLSLEAGKAMDDLIRAERLDRARHARDGVTVTGVVAAPGTIGAFSLRAEWSNLLMYVERFLVSRLEAAGLCHLVTRPSNHDVSDDERYARVVVLLSGCRRVSWLRSFHADLVDLNDRIDRCVNGTQIKAMPELCPWCGHQTLVADLNALVITCGRDPHTGLFEPCVCSDSYCACKTTIRHRHTWHRDHKAHKTTSWHGLNDHIRSIKAGDTQ